MFLLASIIRTESNPERRGHFKSVALSSTNKGRCLSGYQPLNYATAFPPRSVPYCNIIGTNILRQTYWDKHIETNILGQTYWDKHIGWTRQLFWLVFLLII